MKLWIVLISQVASWALVSFGQPALYPWLGAVSSAVGFALHWRSLDGLSEKVATRISFLWFFLVQLIHLSWMTSISYQGICGLLLYFLLSVLMGCQFAFFTWQIRRSLVFSIFSVLVLSSLWTLLEWSRLYFLCGFAFNFVGLSLSCNSYSLQTASLFGVLGMSFFVVVTNLLGLRALRAKTSMKLFAQWGSVIAVPYLFGFAHMTYHDFMRDKGNDGFYSVLLLQTGLLPSEKYQVPGRAADFIHPINQWKFILKEIAKHKEKELDLLVFPEAALPFGFDQDIYDIEYVRKLFFVFFGSAVQDSFPSNPVGSQLVANGFFLQTLSNLLKAQVIAGLDFQEGEVNYNSAFFFEPGKTSAKRYDKRVLLPIVEYMPFEKLKSLSKSYGINNFFTAGTRSEVLGSFSLSPSICYEELFSSLMREGRIKGANLFVNLTNDGWYPSSSLPEQHFVQGLIRAVENGVPVARSCNTGITGAVDSLGRVVARLGEKGDPLLEKSGSLHVSLSKYHYKTIFSFLGEWVLVSSCTLLCFFSFLIKKKKRKKVFLTSEVPI